MRFSTDLDWLAFCIREKDSMSCVKERVHAHFQLASNVSAEDVQLALEETVLDDTQLLTLSEGDYINLSLSGARFLQNVTFESIPDWARRLPDVALAVVQRSGDDLGELSDFQTDRGIVTAAVMTSPSALQYASEDLRKDEDLVMMFCLRQLECLKHAHPDLLNSKKFILALVQRNGQALQHASERFKGDLDVVMAAVQG